MPDYVEEMLNYIVENAVEIDLDQRYEDMLDECYSFKDVGGPFSHMLPSQVLKEMDPTAFSCGRNDYSDGDTVEIRGNDYERSEVERLRDDFIEEKEAELEADYDAEYADWEASEPVDDEDLDQEHFDTLFESWQADEPMLDTSDLDACRRYTF